MRPLKLEISAFGPYVDRIILDFEKGLGSSGFFLVHGPTGAGKTSILDAICFALYGSSSGGERAGTMLRAEQADPSQDTEVCFTFSLGDRIYRVRRNPTYMGKKTRGTGLTKKTADAELYRLRDGAEELLEHGSDKVTDYVEGLLGFESKQFRQVVLLPQGEFKRFLMADSGERQEILKVLFKTGMFDRIEEILKEKAKSLELELNGKFQERGVLLNEARAEDEAALLKRLEELGKQLKEQNHKTEIFEKAHSKAQDDLQQGKRLAEQFNELSEALKQLKADEEKIPKVEENRAHLERADRAAALMDKEAFAAKGERDLKNRQREAAEARELLAELELKLKKAREEYERRQQEESLRKDCEERLRKLNEYGMILKELQDFKEAAEVSEREASVARSKAEAAARELAGIQKLLQEFRENQKEAELVVSREQAISMIVKQAERRDAIKALLDELLKQEQEAEGLMLKLGKEAQDAGERAREMHNTWERLWLLAQKGSAAFLAKELAEGDPCPVCGSIHHPMPAVSEDVIPSRDELEKAEQAMKEQDELQKRADKAEAEANTAYEAAVAKRRAVQKQWDDEFANIKEEDIVSARAEMAKVEQAKATLEMLKKDIEEGILGEEKLKARKEAADQKAVGLAEEAARRKGSFEEKQRRLPEEYRDGARLSRETAKTVRQQKELQEAWKQAEEAFHKFEVEFASQRKASESAEEAVKVAMIQAEDSSKVFADALKDAGFSSPEEYSEILRGPWRNADARDKLRKQLKEFDLLHFQHKEALRSAEEVVKGKEAPQLEKLESFAREAERAWKEQIALKSEVESEEKLLKRLYISLEKLAGESRELEKAHGIAAKLSWVASFGSDGNKISFHRYVLRSLFRDVIDAANLRLELMSQGRYRLQNKDAAKNRNAKAGLEIEIFDEYSGKERPTETLSGGESFLASLSLALGLADVVQSYSGGIRLDTMFIDEGFGSLDSETLDMALRALMELQQGGRLVGIISHVEELRQRIPVQLEVTRGRHGSSARFVNMFVS